jgi:tetratricopeptide (TPR) repeat protein
MFPHNRLRASALLAVAIAAGAPASAADPNGATTLKVVLVPRQASSELDRASECLQRTPDFALWDQSKKIIPSAAGYVYRVERAEAGRLLVSDRSEGLRGWVPASAVVPLNQAAPCFAAQVQANPQSSFAVLMRGIVRLENGETDQAAADIDEALRLDPKFVSALVTRAYLWQCKNHLDRALDDASRAIELDPKNAYAYIERGIFEYGAKQYDKSLRDLDAATELGSNAALVHVARGMIAVAKGDSKNAAAEFRKAIEIDPKHPDAYCGYASLFLMQGNTKKALAVLDLAIESDPRSPESHGNRAIVLLSIGRFDKALDDLDEVLRVAPASARAHRERAWLLATCPEAKIRDGEEAVRSATRACELSGWKEPHCLATLAAACSEAGDFSSAVRWQENAVELTGDKDPEKSNYRRLLDRYKAKKPYHRLRLLEELGVQSSRPAAKKDD